jgi:putative addiction module CopG family antidote
MEIELTPEEREFIRYAIETGRLRQAEDAVHEALELWMDREREREEILAALDEAEASLARGEGLTITPESMRDLAEDIKQRGRARIARERKAAR